MDERAGSGCNILNHDTEFVHIFNLQLTRRKIIRNHGQVINN